MPNVDSKTAKRENVLKNPNMESDEYCQELFLSQQLPQEQKCTSSLQVSENNNRKVHNSNLEKCNYDVGFHENRNHLVMTPEKNKSSNFCLIAQETSPILESSFSFNRKSHARFHSSTPANCHNSNSTSPEYKKTELVLNVLDRLCSPIADKKSSGRKTYETSYKSDVITKSKPKRLFDVDCKKSLQHKSKSKQNKCSDKTNKGIKLDLGPANDNLLKRHDISDRILEVVCEANDLNQIHKRKFNNINVKSSKNFEKLNLNKVSPIKNESVNIVEEAPVITSANFNTLIYPTVTSCNNSRKLSLTDLLQSVKVLEEANKTKDITGTLREKNLLSCDVFNLPFSSDQQEKVKSCESIDDPVQGDDYFATKGEPINDSISITDTQFCEAVEAAELMTDFDRTLNNSTCEASRGRTINQMNNKTSDIELGICNKFRVGLVSHQETSYEKSELCGSYYKIQGVNSTDNVSAESLQNSENRTKDCEEIVATESISQLKSESKYESIENELESFDDKSCFYDSVVKGFKPANVIACEISKKPFKKPSLLIKDHSKVEDCSIKNLNYKSGNILKYLHESPDNSICYFNEEEVYNKLGSKDLKISISKDDKIYKTSPEKVKLFHEVRNLFKTASGKEVKVSDSSLKKAIVLLDDHCNPVSCPSEVFKTVSERTDKVTDKSINNVKHLFDKGTCLKRLDKNLSKINSDLLDVSNVENRFGLPAVTNSETTTIDEFVNVCDLPTGDKQILSNVCNFKENTANGFQTASGKNIKVSDELLKKARQLLFSDECSSASATKAIKSPSGTAIESVDKPLKVANQSSNNQSEKQDCYKKGMHLCHKEINVEEYKAKQFHYTNNKTLPEEFLKKEKKLFDDHLFEKNHFKGFITANGKTVDVSEKSLKQAKNLFSDRDTNEDQLIAGFKTAAGKTVQISDRSLVEARKLFDNQSISEYNFTNVLKSPNGNNLNKNVRGFQTASGKNVECSTESLQKARKLLDDTCAIGTFKTAGGKTVNVSELSLKKVKHLFDDENNSTMANGFVTANGRSIQVSHKSLKKARHLMNDELSNKGTEVKESKQLMKSSLDNLTVQFQTASGRFVDMSEESLKKAKELFEDPCSSKDCLMKGFKTASGNGVEVTGESLKIARCLFNDDENQFEGPKINDNETDVERVSEISNVSLEKVKGLFDNRNNYEKHNFEGFQTANGALVEISDESLKCARQLFGDDAQTVCITERLSQTRNSRISSNGRLTSNDSSNSHLDMKDQLTVGIKNEWFTDEVLKETKILCNHTEHNRVKPNTPPSNSNLKSKENNIQRKRRKLFHDSNNPDTFKNIPIPVFEELQSSSMYSSVISEDDLNLLNQSLTNCSNRFNSPIALSRSNYQNKDRLRIISPTVAQEVSESMAALMADEESNSSWLLKPCLSTPAMIFDRHVKLPSIDCDEKDSQVEDKQLSPILDSYSHFKPAKKFKKNATLTAFQEAQLSGGSGSRVITPLTKSGNFKPPYATSTPNETLLKQHIKRELHDSHNEFPSAKRKKTAVEHTILNEKENVFVDVSEARKKALEIQEKIIKEKTDNHKSVKPCKGSYLLRKQTEISRAVQYLTNHRPLQLHTVEELTLLDVQVSILNVSSRNAEEFKFVAKNYFSDETCSINVDGIPVGDGALLILDGEGRAGIEEVTRAFLSSPAVDPTLISVEWVKNHFKWIVLKMASMERMFPERLANRYLTPNNLMLQLKYRYDREIDKCQRPALRKVLEKDESPAKSMVLFVAEILDVENKDCGGKKELELSDGWYSIKATIDYEMEILIRRGIVRVGTKLLITGADVINNEEGCHPLETPSNVRLRVSTNSTRRARWYARLGFHPRTPPPIRLEGILGRGGTIPSLTAVVARTYPLLFLEKLGEGKTVIRGERAEQIAADEYHVKRQQCAEVILSQLEHEVEHPKSSSKQPITRQSVKEVQDTYELYSLMKGIDDISVFQDVLSKDQLNQIQEHRQEESSKIQQQLQENLVKQLDKKMTPRAVTRMLKVRLVDTEKLFDRSALLTVWNPSDDVLSILTEGNSLVFHSVSASGYSRFGDLQLSGGRQTRYNLERFCGVPRTMTPLQTLCDPSFKPPFAEIDVVGVVLPTVETSSGSNPKLVYVADANHNFLSISFWTELKVTGFANIVSPGSLIAASNLHWQSNLVSWSLPSAFATEMSTFSQNPRQAHLQEALKHLNNCTKSLNMKTYTEDCMKRIKSLLAQRNSAGLLPSSSTSVSTLSADTRHSFVSKKEETVSCSTYQLDDNAIQNIDTPTNRRLVRLEQYGEPPPISPLLLCTPSRVKRHFRPPTRRPLDENK